MKRMQIFRILLDQPLRPLLLRHSSADEIRRPAFASGLTINVHSDGDSDDDLPSGSDGDDDARSIALSHGSGSLFGPIARCSSDLGAPDELLEHDDGECCKCSLTEIGGDSSLLQCEMRLLCGVRAVALDEDMQGRATQVGLSRLQAPSLCCLLS